ncbi:MAG: MFS transporter [Rickettsiaceae bacterium]|nr:MFS transporter [Rickettsiaceae bacterium]
MYNEKKLTKSIVFSCFLASCLEIYDFVIFGFMSKVIHVNYLTFLDQEKAILISYVFLAVGFIFRPLGSLVFGYIGDVFGRKKSLILSVSMMGFASITMFLLPSYSMIGILGCYIIVFIRIVQGISVGGEFTGAIIFAVEHNKKKNAGLVTGIVSAGGACGVLLASFVTTILQSPSMPDYSWRYAFLLGFGLSIIGYFIRKKISDTPVFIITQKSKSIPLLEGLKKFKIESFATLCLAAANGVTFYFGAVYLVKFISQVRVNDNVSFIPILVSSTMAFSLPFFGKISDIFGRKKILLISTLLMSTYSFISLELMVYASSTFQVGLYAFLYTLIAATMIGSINVLAVEMFPPEYRMSCSSLFYSLGMGFIGGTVPMVSSLIVEYLGENPKYLGGYISIVCLMAFIGVLLVKIKHNKREKKSIMFNVETVTAEERLQNT